MAGLLAVSLSQHNGHLAAILQPADVGRVCGFHLCYCFRNVLVCRSFLTSPHCAIERASRIARSFMECWRWAGAARRIIGIATRWPIYYWPGLSTPLCSRSTQSSASILPLAIIPGWHATIFPPYFVAGAIYSGFAMVLTMAIPLRKLYGLEDFITMRHLKNMGMVMLATGLIVAYGYLMETFMAWYSGDDLKIIMI